MPQSIKLLLLDIGGVLLTDGWETKSREKAAAHFSLDFDELNQRHKNVFDAYESGKMSLDQYLDLVIFHQERTFGRQEFKDFMLGESKPLEDMIAFMKALKQQYRVPIATVNNEPLELNEHRIKTCGLSSFIDVFVSSCYVNLRKPDPKIYQLALSIMQAKPEEALYIDDRKVYTEQAAAMGINTIHHTGLETTREQLKNFNFTVSST
ncbi:HAD family phosphatase [Mucilaginibacter sp. RS28]|uniref:HAD family phosphatase n=1 Tax=Mucilaginibacter straminoryzae TaxID=2932774 RepID=A0A9X1X0Z0_9SPHI|nr:HAD family phosphatase [Mucilaginibacter straminoryzae]MCJ8209227.1 HAD family phosphatase [Mucilaginibacter straminoryzae]